MSGHQTFRSVCSYPSHSLSYLTQAFGTCIYVSQTIWSLEQHEIAGRLEFLLTHISITSFVCLTRASLWSTYKWIWSVCLCSRLCVCVVRHMKVQLCLCKFFHPALHRPPFVFSPAARLRQWNNTQSYGLPGFKDLHCVRRWLRMPVRPHTCSGAHGPLRGCCNARLRPPWADQRFPRGHQRPTGTRAHPIVENRFIKDSWS